jgi:hypothetical protein
MSSQGLQGEAVKAKDFRCGVGQGRIATQQKKAADPRARRKVFTLSCVISSS